VSRAASAHRNAGSAERHQVERFDLDRHRLDESLDDHGHALASTHAHALEAESFVRVFERVEQGRHDARAGHAKRVTERDGPSADIELL
jgi:hypothetical protein